ncbi:cation channel family protein (macronuclear) [Tetrahymena thermophila SB210]|uniref:Cation channel family protein n=1 Tax=Tetrahymena thermophila (strain SB210) TaxID=312017 RepID=W7XH22_TETTS|nr:cation channel family protein [Tetrahymena thermophila SB210]EWS73606.1 cation channel family protein [Tetrahymena thermophila SB210]|eukprot:XP_012653836.1 cation channel family protein [Tetrahymena thermophila SB210]
MNQNQHFIYENYMHNQYVKPFQEVNKSAENSLSSFSSAKKNPFIKVRQVSVVDILKGDDQDSFQSQTKLTQNNIHQFSQNVINAQQNHVQNTQNSQESHQCSKIIEEEYSNTHKTDNGMEIQVDYSYNESHQRARESDNEQTVHKQSFTQIIGQLVKKKRKNNIELEYITSKNVWKKKWLGILFYVSKFLYIAKQTQQLFRAALLTSFQLHLIGDAASDLDQNDNFSKLDLRIISLFLLFAGSLFYGHLFACLWYYVGTQNEEGWINFNQLDRSDIYSNYICSYYYAVITMTTIGYGDITAKTTNERFVMIFLALLSCGIFGFTINSIGNILSDFKQKSDMYLTELGKLNKFLSYYQVSTQVQTNARKYLKFVHQEKNKDQLSTLQSLTNLSDYLQNQIKMEVISKKLKQIHFFRNVLKEETILKLSLQVKESIYQPEQIILGQNEVKEPSIYIINHGRVLKYSQYDITAKENSIVELKEKENFGLIEFFMNTENSYFNYKSKELTSIFSIQLSSFLKIIKQDNESYEKFCYIRDQVIYQQYLSQVNYSCLSCQSKNHTLKECPCIFYNSRKINVIKKNLQQEKEILEIKRSNKKKQNCWILFELNNSKALDFQNDNINQLSYNECSQITDEEQDDNKGFYIQEQEIADVEPNKIIFTQNLLKINEERDNFISHKTSEVLNEDDCSIGKIGSELKPQIMIQPRRNQIYDQQRSDEIKKQNSNLMEHQLDEELSKQGQIVSLNSQKNISQTIHSSANIAQNQSQYFLQNLMQNLKDIQILLSQNLYPQKVQQKQGNISRRNTKRVESSNLYNFKKEYSSSLLGSNNNVKHAKSISHSLLPILTKHQKSIVEFEFQDEEFDKLHQFKIYYPLNNFDTSLNYEKYLPSQFSKSLQDESKNIENSQTSFNSGKKTPFIKIKQVSVVDILKGDDQDSVQSFGKITQNNINQQCHNYVYTLNQGYDSSHTQDSQQCSKIIEEEYSIMQKTQNDPEIQVDCSKDDSNQKEKEIENEVQKQSFTQIVGQLIKKKRKNNIELEYINSKDVWKKKWLGVLFYVSKFLYIAKQCQKVFRASLLTSFQLHLIGDISSDFEQNESYSKLDLTCLLNQIGIISLFLLFAGSLFYGHLFACFWYYVGTQSEQGWIHFNQLDINNIYSNYICSYYYAVVTMTTIGYGDITAKTDQERFVMIFLALLSCGIFGFTINSIGNILSDFKQKSDMYLTELGKLNKYLSFYQVSSQVQINARKYLKFIHQEKNKDQLSTFQSLNNLSDYLQNQIKMEVISKKLKQIKFLTNILKEEIILQLSLQVQERIYQPEQIILDQNENKEPAIYLINHGRVLKYSQYDITAKENSIVELKEKENFGLIEFFMNKENSNFNYKSKGITSIFSLELSSFLKIIKQDDESYEKFCYVKDQIIYQQYLSQVNYFCLSCQSKNHTLKECPCIFYNERHLSIVKKTLQQNQELYDKKRQIKKKQNCRKLFDQIYSKAIDFQNNNINQLSFNECSQLTEEEDDDHEYEEQEKQNNNSKNLFIEGIEKLEAEARKSIFTQNLLKVNEEKDSFISHKTGEVLNEDDCSIGKIASELKPQIMIQPRRNHTYDFQKSEEMKKQNSNLIEHQQDDDFFRHGRMISLNSQKNVGQLNQPSANIAQNQNSNIIQNLVQNLKEFQNFLQQNQSSQKAPLKQGNFNKLTTKRLDSSSIIFNIKNEHSNSLNGSNNQNKQAKQNSFTFFEAKNSNEKSQQKIQICEEDLDKLQLFKIYYPLSNYDLVIAHVNKSHLQFKIPQILKNLKLKKRGENQIRHNPIL